MTHGWGSHHSAPTTVRTVRKNAIPVHCWKNRHPQCTVGKTAIPSALLEKTPSPANCWKNAIIRALFSKIPIPSALLEKSLAHSWKIDVTSALLTNRQCTVGKFPITSALFSKSAFQAHCWKNCHNQRTVEKIVSALQQNHECSVRKITSALLAQSPARCLKNHWCLLLSWQNHHCLYHKITSACTDRKITFIARSQAHCS